MKRTLVVLLVLGLAPLIASADLLTFSIQYETTFTNDTTASTNGTGTDRSTMLFNSGANPVGYNTHWVSRFAIYLQASFTNPNDYFQTAGFGISAGTSANTYGAWTNFGTAGNGHNGIILATKYASGMYKKIDTAVTYVDPADYPNIGSASAEFSANSDTATANDLRGIVATMDLPVSWGMANNSPAAGPTVAPQKVGVLFIRWDGTAAGAKISVFGDPNVPSSSWGKYANATLVQNEDESYTLQGGVGTSITGNVTNGYSLEFGAPEPATMVLLALGGMGMLIRRRRA